MGIETAEDQKMPFIPREFGLALKVQLSKQRVGRSINHRCRRNQCRYKPTSH
jgi:hypothetical protein